MVTDGPPVVSEAQSQAVRSWSQRLGDSQARGLMVLAGPSPWRAAVIDLISDHRQSAPWPIPGNERVDAVVGREAELVHLDAKKGLDVDLLAATAGTVRAGGILILTVPALSEWSSARDAAVERHLSHGYAAADYGDRFLARLRQRLNHWPDAWLLAPETRELPPAAQTVAPAEPPADAEAATVDQAAAITAIQRCAQGRARRPLLITADRGRGKSTAMGIAARRLQMAHPDQHVMVTAPRRANAARLLAQADLPFEAPDELLRQGHIPDVLLVDEAAGIPIPTLLDLSERCPRVVFATTVHGYEGTGRGFALRFDGQLRAAGQAPRHITLETPIRWRAQDPLESFLADALLLDAEPPEAPGDVCRVAKLDRDALVADEGLLRGVFGLLVAAHYRTRPTDLRQLLDAPEIAVHAALDNADRPVAVALTADEGPLPTELQTPIWLGRRRVRGHLTPQSLAMHAGQADAPALAFRRILRIAVAPHHRRCGIGASLVEHVLAEARDQQRDAVTASFGATATLMPFWHAVGMPPVRLGHRRDRASGTHSAMVMTPLTPAAEALYQRLRHALANQLAYHLPGAFQSLAPALVGQCLIDTGSQAPAGADWWAIAAFGVGQRNRLDALPALTALARWALASDRAGIANSERDLLVTAVIQQLDEAEAAARLGWNGRRAVDSALRQAVARLAATNAPQDVAAFVADAAEPNGGDSD